MEKTPTETYRDDLADKLKDIRNADKEVAHDYLNAVSETPEYQEAKEEHHGQKADKFKEKKNAEKIAAVKEEIKKMTGDTEVPSVEEKPESIEEADVKKLSDAEIKERLRVSNFENISNNDLRQETLRRDWIREVSRSERTSKEHKKMAKEMLLLANPFSGFFKKEGFTGLQDSADIWTKTGDRAINIFATATGIKTVYGLFMSAREGIAAAREIANAKKFEKKVVNNEQKKYMH